MAGEHVLPPTVAGVEGRDSEGGCGGFYSTASLIAWQDVDQIQMRLEATSDECWSNCHLMFIMKGQIVCCHIHM